MLHRIKPNTRQHPEHCYHPHYHPAPTGSCPEQLKPHHAWAHSPTTNRHLRHPGAPAPPSRLLPTPSPAVPCASTTAPSPGTAPSSSGTWLPAPHSPARNNTHLAPSGALLDTNNTQQAAHTVLHLLQQLFDILSSPSTPAHWLHTARHDLNQLQHHLQNHTYSPRAWDHIRLEAHACFQRIHRLTHTML
ncbi:Interferon alpha [Aix galericulata]|nr:Interferon alpha [Aix galericulata]